MNGVATELDDDKALTPTPDSNAHLGWPMSLAEGRSRYLHYALSRASSTHAQTFCS